MHIIEYKSYQIKPHKDMPTSYVVATSGQGGKVPDVLTGMFTSTSLAKREIDTYLSNKQPKEKEDGKKGSKGGD